MNFLLAILNRLTHIFIAFGIFARGFLVINEEFLIMIAFLIVISAFYFLLKDMIAEELYLRSERLKSEFQELLKLQIDYLERLNQLDKRVEMLYDRLYSRSRKVMQKIELLGVRRNWFAQQMVDEYLENMLTTYAVKYMSGLRNIYFRRIRNVENVVRARYNPKS